MLIKDKHLINTIWPLSDFCKSVTIIINYQVEVVN